MKKIALPTRNGNIDDHFGHCAFYTIITVNDNNEVAKTEIMPSPEGCGCKSNIAYQLQEDGVTLMLAGNMGMGALNKLSYCGIEVVRGCSGPVMDVVEAYLKGEGVGTAGYADVSKALAAYGAGDTQIEIAAPRPVRTDAELIAEYSQRPELQECLSIFDGRIDHCRPL